jgi:uncharacterized membrane protein YhaH (DUF805 family)
MAGAGPADARFLFRTDEGRIGRRVWWRGAGVLAAPLLVLTAIWLRLIPDARHDLGTTPLIAAAPLIAYSYLIVYAFAVVLIAISFTNLSAKRWRDRGRPAPTALAGLVPFLALLSGAAHWLQPRVATDMSYGYVIAVDALLAVAAVWTVVELGLQPGVAPPP